MKKKGNAGYKESVAGTRAGIDKLFFCP